MSRLGEPQPPAERSRARRVLVLLILGGLVALGPLSTDAYVPGLPQLADELLSSASAAQLTVTTCLIGLAAGQLLAGPLSDAFGRRRPLIVGVAVYTVAGLLCALAPTIGTLIAARALQGVGGAFALVIAYATVRDLFSGTAAARYFSLLLLVTGLAPVLAPLAGAAVLTVAGWRAVFVALAGLSAVVLIATIVALPESLPQDRRQSGGLRVAAGTSLRLLRDRPLLSYALTNALVFAAMFAYIAGSPFVLQHSYGLSPQQYSAVFAVNAIGLVAAAQASGRLVGRVGPRRLVTIGAIGSGVGGLALLGFVLIAAGLWPILGALFIVVSSVGLVLPNAAALALEQHGSTAGSASALLGFAQYLLGGIAAPLVGVSGVNSAVPMAVVIAVLGSAAIVALIALPRTGRVAVPPAVRAATTSRG